MNDEYKISDESEAFRKKWEGKACMVVGDWCIEPALDKGWSVVSFDGMEWEDVKKIVDMAVETKAGMVMIWKDKKKKE